MNPTAHALEAERSVLGAILLDAQVIERVHAIICAADFQTLSHRAIFETSLALYAAGAEVDPVSVETALAHRSPVRLDVLVGMCASVTTTSLAEQHATLVREASTARQLIALGNGIVSAAQANGVSAQAQVANARTELGRIRLASAKEALAPTAAEVLASAVDLPPERAYPSGFDQLDECLGGGLRSRQLTLLIGPPGCGKSALSYHLAAHWAARYPVLVASLELDAIEVAQRVAAARLDIALDRIARGEISAARAAQGVAGLRLHVLGQAELAKVEGGALKAIASQAAAIAAQQGPPVVIVDYLQLLAYANPEDDRRLAVAVAALELRALAQAIDGAVLAVSSTARTGYSSEAAATRRKRKPDEEEDPREWLGTGKESGELEFHAASVLYLDTASQADIAGDYISRIVVAKSRRGHAGFVGARFNGPTGLWTPNEGAVAALGPAALHNARQASDDREVTAAVAKRKAQPLPRRELRSLVAGIPKQRVEEAIKRLLEDGTLAERRVGRVNARGQVRPTPVVVLACELAIHDQEELDV